MVGPEEIDRRLRGSAEGRSIRGALLQLFGDEDSEGVHDVLAFASTLGDEDRELVVRAVVDLFGKLRQA